jgi:hypothetical protein
MEVRMTRLLFAGLLMSAWAAAAAPPAAAKNRETGPWWPHPIWGPEDQAGGSNWITPDKILEARFEDLLADRAYEFLFVFTPLRLKGATGSPGRPLAIR